MFLSSSFSIPYPFLINHSFLKATLSHMKATLPHMKATLPHMKATLPHTKATLSHMRILAYRAIKVSLENENAQKRIMRWYETI